MSSDIERLRRSKTIRTSIPRLRRSVNVLSNVSSLKREKEMSKFLFPNDSLSTEQMKDKELNENQLEFGIADFIGFCGFDVMDYTSSCFDNPFSVSYKLSPSLLSYLCCDDRESELPNKLEWFCFPNGIHLRRAIPPLIQHHVSSELLVGIEYLLTCLPCNSLFVSRQSISSERKTYIMNQFHQFSHISSKHSFLNLESIQKADLQPEEIIEGISSILQSSSPLIPFSFQRNFTGLLVEEITESPLSSTTITWIKSQLQQLPEKNIVTLYYILSFIHFFIESNRTQGSLFEDWIDSSSPLSDSDSLSDEMIQISEYYNRMNYTIKSLIPLSFEYIQLGLEEIAHFFFHVIWQVSEELSSQQKNTLYSIFLIMILHFHSFFDFVEDFLNETNLPNHSSQPTLIPSSSDNTLFVKEPPTSTYYTMLCNGNSVYYCYCYSFYQYTQVSPSQSFYIPTCFFLVSILASPTEYLSLLPPLVAILQENDQQKVIQLKQFLFQDCLKPVPNLLTIHFTLNSIPLSLSSYLASEHLINRIDLSFFSHSIAICLKQLFQTLSIHQIIHILLLLFLEEKVLIVTNNITILPTLLEAFLLLLPYSWPHAFIPLIPYYLLPILIESPSPFLFGTSLSTFSFVKDTIPSDVHVLFLNQDFTTNIPSIPPLPKRYLIHSIHSLDFSLSPLSFYHQCKDMVYSFFWLLLPSFSKYLFTLLGNVCLFNTEEYLKNEIEKIYLPFYSHFLSTQSFVMFTDHFWSPPYKDLINSNKQHLSTYQQHQNIQRFFTFQYPDFSFSSHISSSSSLHFDSFSLGPHLSSSSTHISYDYSSLQSLFDCPIPHTPSSPSFHETKEVEVFSHRILNAMNRLFTSYLQGIMNDQIAELTEYIKEALNEKNIRNDFVRILYQPASSFSSFHILSLPAAQSLAILFNTFYTYCVTQRDYLNALRLHKITATFIIQEQDHQVPLYSFLYTHAIYTKIGFWKELLVDYCLASHDEESAYQMQYHCLLDSQFVKTKKTKLSQIWFYAEKNSFLNTLRQGGKHDDEAEDIQIIDVMAYDQENLEGNHGHERTRSICTSYVTISRAFAYLSELMIDLRVADEFAHQIIIALIRLISD